MEIAGEIRHTQTGTASDAASVKQRESASGVHAERQDGAAKTDSPVPSGADAAAAQHERLSTLLQSYGFKVNDKNLAMLTLMLENALPLSKENVMRMNQALKLTDSPEKALFLLMNNIRLTRGNAAQLDGLTDGRIRITEQIGQLLAAVAELTDPALKSQILRILSNVENAVFQTPSAAETTDVPAQAAQEAIADAETLGDETTAARNPGTAEGNTRTAAADMRGETQQSQGTQAGRTAGEPLSPAAGSPQTPQSPPTAANPQAPPGASTASAAQTAITAQSSNAGNIPGEAQSSDSAQSLRGMQTTEAGQRTLGAQTPEENPVLRDAQSTGAGQPTQDTPPTETGLFTRETLPTVPGQTNATRMRPGVPEPAADAFRLARPDAPEAHTVSRQTDRPDAPYRLSYRLADSTPEDIDRFTNSLRNALQETRQALSDGRHDTPETARVMRQVASLSEHIDFVAQIKNQLFMQLPIYNNGQETHTALHVYRDGKSDKQQKGGTHSALIALDTAYMGHFETYVQKSDQSVTCQFRLRDKDVEQRVRANIHKLDALLREYHYSLDAFNFLPPGEPYTLLDAPDIFEGRANESAAEKTFVFDKRI